MHSRFAVTAHVVSLLAATMSGCTAPDRLPDNPPEPVQVAPACTGHPLDLDGIEYSDE